MEVYKFRKEIEVFDTDMRVKLEQKLLSIEYKNFKAYTYAQNPEVVNDIEDFVSSCIIHDLPGSTADLSIIHEAFTHIKNFIKSNQNILDNNSKLISRCGNYKGLDIGTVKDFLKCSAKDTKSTWYDANVCLSCDKCDECSRFIVREANPGQVEFGSFLGCDKQPLGSRKDWKYNKKLDIWYYTEDRTYGTTSLFEELKNKKTSQQEKAEAEALKVNPIHSKIMSFIEKFDKHPVHQRYNNSHETLYEIFMAGFCYHFALILQNLFPGGKIQVTARKTADGKTYYSHCVYTINTIPYDYCGINTDDCEDYVDFDTLSETQQNSFKHIDSGTTSIEDMQKEFLTN